MCVIKSVTMIPMADDEDIANTAINRSIELYWPKPENFIRIVSLKDESGSDVDFKELDTEIEMTVTKIGPLDLCYEVKQDPIFVQLNLICSGKGD